MVNHRPAGEAPEEDPEQASGDLPDMVSLYENETKEIGAGTATRGETAAVEVDSDLSLTAADASDKPAVVQEPDAGHRMEDNATGATAWRSLALEHDGRVYAFGAHWLVFGKTAERDLRPALREAEASHWYQIGGSGVTQVAAYRLGSERGRIYAAAGAVRAQYGGDVLCVFELNGETVRTTLLADRHFRGRGCL